VTTTSDRTARITRISTVAGYVVAAGGVVALAGIGLSMSFGEPWGVVSDLGLLVVVGAVAPLMLAFYELGGLTPLRMAQLAQILGWLSVAVFVVVELQVLAGLVDLSPHTAATGAVVAASLGLGYIGLWIAGANLLAGPWLSAVRWLGLAAGLAAVLFAAGTVAGGLDSSWRLVGGVGFVALGALWAFLIARLLGRRDQALEE
jgi:hypothetical protein